MGDASRRRIGEETRLRRALAACEERLQSTLAELDAARRQASEDRDRSLAVVVHELRIPLAPMLVMAEVLEGDAELSPRQREAAATIRRSIELEARLVDDLSDLTRVAFGKLQLALAETDAERKLQEVLVGCDRQVKEKRLALVLRLGATDHCVLADPARLHQILWNLLYNAVKFTPPYGSITVRSENPQPRRLVLQVTDTGMGIEPELLQRIFEPFVQGGKDVARKFGGLGIGLAISKSLVEAQGGTLTAWSEGLGKGAVFTLELPLAHGQPMPTA